ncbi:hypothetical protein PVK06_043613 [Gossypium arboreum]|uniref:Uncharacterized protein n=1 Tax=Gossypium arboreum TaxID=29729 RepID=A0ABR0MP32_GOSAR|nr:hypothetical protein PVK06_043613 [Gossypium arboreum]
MRGVHGKLVLRYPPRDHASKTLVEANFFPCITKYEEMHQALRVQGIDIPNFAYELSIHKGSHRTNGGEAQLRRLHVSSSLVIEDVITVRNVFLYYLEGHNPNGYKWGDSREVVEALGAVSEG